MSLHFGGGELEPRLDQSNSFGDQFEAIALRLIREKRYLLPEREGESFVEFCRHHVLSDLEPEHSFHIFASNLANEMLREIRGIGDVERKRTISASSRWPEFWHRDGSVSYLRDESVFAGGWNNLNGSWRTTYSMMSYEEKLTPLQLEAAKIATKILEQEGILENSKYLIGRERHESRVKQHDFCRSFADRTFLTLPLAYGAGSFGVGLLVHHLTKGTAWDPVVPIVTGLACLVVANDVQRSIIHRGTREYYSSLLEDQLSHKIRYFTTGKGEYIEGCTPVQIV